MIHQSIGTEVQKKIDLSLKDIPSFEPVSLEQNNYVESLAFSPLSTIGINGNR
jgi:hypothetical protein